MGIWGSYRITAMSSTLVFRWSLTVDDAGSTSTGSRPAFFFLKRTRINSCGDSLQAEWTVSAESSTLMLSCPWGLDGRIDF